MEAEFSELILADDAKEVGRRYGEALSDPARTRVLGAELEELAEGFVDSQDEDVIPDMDYSDESLMRLDDLLSDLLMSIGDEDDGDGAGADLETLEPVIIDMGSYLAKVIHDNLGGQWRFRHDLMNASLYFERLKLECFPFHQVMKRIARGEEDSLMEFYENLVERLCAD